LNIASNTPALAMSEAEMIEHAKQGDDECFKLLYDLHKRRVYSVCLRMIANRETAEDLAQEAFLQLHRKIATFRGDSAFSTWLHRLTVNAVLMYMRKGRLIESSLDEPQDEDGEAPKTQHGKSDPSLVGLLDRVTLERAIESLPPGYRIVFVLHDVEGHDHNEIAGMLGCSAGNTKSQLHKARLKLRDFLSATAADKVRSKKPVKTYIPRGMSAAMGLGARAIAYGA
jgi:RNA polymerase sigma-70 factor (ECF subfamily)